MSEKTSISETMTHIGTARVLCVGDVMMDRFIYGAIERISPEAPIPVLRAQREKHMLGGVGNVVANIVALGARVTLAAVTGTDDAGTEIRELLEAMGATSALVSSDERATTVKSRFVSGGQQMLRVDREHTHALPHAVEDDIIARATAAIPSIDVVILSDYNKGTLTPRVVEQVIKAARAQGKPVIVDPKGRDFSKYHGATVITPNRLELETATHMSAATDDDVRAAAMKVIAATGSAAVLATRGKDGMSLIAADAEPLHLPADVREVYDVSGAGDTVISIFATALAAGASFQDAAILANVAAGIVVGKAGTATVRPDEIRAVIDNKHLTGSKHMYRKKLVTKEQAAEQAERWRARGFSVGFTNGTFDLLHPGHLSSIRQAKEACDYLVVALNSDASVKRYKGPTRPLQGELARAEVLCALGMVDLVVIFEEDTPMALLEAIRPDVLVKGGQYKMEEVVGYELVTSYGGKILRADMEEGFSTTNTVKKMAG